MTRLSIMECFCYQMQSWVIISATRLQEGEDCVVFRRNREKIREGAIRGGTLANVVVPILTRHPSVLRPK